MKFVVVSIGTGPNYSLKQYLSFTSLVNINNSNKKKYFTTWNKSFPSKYQTSLVENIQTNMHYGKLMVLLGKFRHV